jgi:hypothetical protein
LKKAVDQVARGWENDHTSVNRTICVDRDRMDE